MAKSPSRSALLARELLARIARRELRPGDSIDLTALGRRHGVSRTVVREALADLGGKGLVVARPKVGTTVAPEACWNLLDPLLIAVAIAEPGPDSLLADATELRRVIEPALAADAARDAGRPMRAAVLDAVRAIAGAIGAHDRDALAEADAALYAAMAEACGNRLLRSIDHSLIPVRALHRQRLLAAQMRADGPGPELLHLLSLQTGLGLAIARQDAERAASLAFQLASAATSASGSAVAGPDPLGHAPPVALDEFVLPQAQRATSTRATATVLVPTPTTGDGPWNGFAALPLALSLGPLASPAPAPAATSAVSPATDAIIEADTDTDAGDDWPDTETLMLPAGLLEPVRRARLDPDDAPVSFAVPALLAEAAGEVASLAGVR
ncbi:MAG: FadR/GntR family transcriptional regulator [Burkholderiaceae bacterium]